MREFLYWKQVQDRLSEHVMHGEEPYNFYDVVRELWEEGAAHRAENSPAVSFAEWDAADFDWFDRIYEQVPVDLLYFHPSFQQNKSGTKASEFPLTSDVIPIRIAYDQAVGRHHHTYFEIDYVMNGEASLVLEGGSRRLYAGDFCFLSPNLPHDVVPEHGAHVISITTPGVTIEQTLYRLLRRDNVLADYFRSVMDHNKTGYMLISTPNERRIREITRGLLHERYSQEEFSADIIQDHLAILFAFMLRSCGEQYEWHGEESERGAQSMLAVLKYIRENYRTLTLNELAERFRYEPSYLGKQIKAATGRNYTEIIREIRLDEAKRLLRTMTLTVDEVAEQVGYTGRVHFFRSFREAVGMTPGNYRKHQM